MKNLKLRVQKMLDGEKKRREVAIKWIEEVEKLLDECSEYLFDANCIGLGNVRFYTAYSNDFCTNCFIMGDSYLTKHKGMYFWNGVEDVIEFIEGLEKNVDHAEVYVDSLMEKINVEGEVEA